MTGRRKLAAFIAVASMALLVAVACGGDGSSLTPTPAPSAGIVLPSPTPEPTPTPTVTPEPAVQRIAYIGTEGGVWVINADGSGKQRLLDLETDRSDHGQNLQWSPDGGRLAVTKSNHTVAAPIRDLTYIVSAEGEMLSELPGHIFLAWSPTGDMFAVARAAVPDMESAVIAFDLEGNIVLETTGLQTGASFSADGARLAYFLVAGRDALYADVQGMVANLKTGPVSPLDQDEEPSAEIYFNGLPIFSPSNPSLLAYGDRLIDLDSAEERSLPGSATSWSPDGQFLLLANCEHAVGGRVYEVATGSSVLEFDFIAPATNVTCWQIIGWQSAWSADSRLLAVSEWPPIPYDTSGVLQGTLHIREVTTGQDKTSPVIASPLGQFPPPQFSPDNAHLVFSNSEGIWLVNADGTNLTLLADGTAPAWQPLP